MRITVVLLVTVFLAAVSAFGSEADSSGSAALIRARISKDLSYAQIISRGIDILAVYPDGTADLVVNEEQLGWIRSVSPKVTVLEWAMLKAPAALDENLGQYHTYLETEVMLDSLAALYPDLTRIDTLGTSIEGRLIRAIKISDNADDDEEEVELLIMGCHHAREIMSVEIPLLFAEYLLDGYGSSPQVTELLNDLEIWIAPMINPDGHVYVQLNHGGDWWTWWRKNRRDNGDGTFGVDLNRNYGYQWGYDDVGSSPVTSSLVYRGPAPFSEPETQAVRDFCGERSISLALSYHSYSELVLYPWSYAPLYTEDHGMFSVLGDSLARGTGYTAGNVAMGTLYTTNGDTDDWAYGETSTKNRFFCFTIELNSYEEGGFAPPESLIAPTFEKTLELNLTLLRRAGDPYSVMGPEPPVLSDIGGSPTPTFKLSWSGPDPSDPNPPETYEIVEYKNLGGTTCHCEAGDTLWEEDGFSFSTVRAYEGSSSFYSGSGDGLNNMLGMATFYPYVLGDTLFCRLWYDIEYYYDFAYLEASLDQGLIWEPVPGNVTTDLDPYGSNRGNGITGNSGGWVEAKFYLCDISDITEDSSILLRFSYITDASVTKEGIYIDLVTPTVYHEGRMVLADAHTSTSYYRSPEEMGDYAYLVRAEDEEGHKSRWSNVEFHTVDELSPAEMPVLRTHLSRNFPNPFNPLTTVRFTVGEEGVGRSGNARVRLELFDVGGHRVAVLRDCMMKPGVYSATWDGRIDGGGKAASGVYFMRLSVGRTALSRKMVLLK